MTAARLTLTMTREAARVLAEMIEAHLDGDGKGGGK